jgi:hypothetical protein
MMDGEIVEAVARKKDDELFEHGRLEAKGRKR